MSVRLSSLVAAGLLVSASAAHSQNAIEPSTNPVLPTPPLTVPITPAPLDEQTQATLEVQKLRGIFFPLKNVPPKLMAYWLDPKNHKSPLVEGVNPTPPRQLDAFVLPEGIERIMALDAPKTFLVFGTEKALAELRPTIEALDRVTLDITAPAPVVVCEASAYWFESDSDAAKQWQNLASSPRIAQPHELEALKAHTNAIVQPFQWRTAQVNSTITFPFEKLNASSPVGNLNLNIPNLNNGEKFNSFMPRIKGGQGIDPNVWPQPNLAAVSGIDQVAITPLETTNDSVRLSFSATRPLIGTLANVPIILSLQNNDTIILTRNADELNLKPFKPNYGTVVFAITVHIAQSPSPWIH
ncbi:hypothetical protein EON83_16715 [bacterium]|nr:MAG: hypothetical protein EON83_16715 [bacterium]